jgi:hypothetical protein
MYLIMHTIFPACDWFWAGIILNETYTNSECRSCELYSDPEEGGYVYQDCVELGFVDVTANAVFILRQLWPDALEWLNTTQLFFISSLVQTEYFQSRLALFADYDPDDPISFSVHTSCGYTYTLLPNMVLMFMRLHALALAAPLVSLIFDLLTSAIYLGALSALFAFNAVMFLLVNMPSKVAMAERQAIEDESHLAHEAAIDTDTPIHKATERIDSLLRKGHRAISKKLQKKKKIKSRMPLMDVSTSSSSVASDDSGVELSRFY